MLRHHRRTRAAGERWVLLPHAYAFVDPLFSTGIAWSLRAIERLALMFEVGAAARSVPNAAELARYDASLDGEADQIDWMVAAAYEGMAHFDLFAAHAMLYFATVSSDRIAVACMSTAPTVSALGSLPGDVMLPNTSRPS